MRTLICAVACVLAAMAAPCHAAQGDQADRFWKVDAVREGMKGYGKTVIKGTKIEKFDVEILGVLKNTSPGRDMILARLAGLNLENTGVIAGMSGSPVYIDGKLLGAVAFAWAFSKEPIAGITPYSQMVEYAQTLERSDLTGKGRPVRVGLRTPIRVGGQSIDSIAVATDPRANARDDLTGAWLTPISTPLTVSGISRRSLEAFRDDLLGYGMTPMQSGAIGANIPEDQRNIPLEAGGALTVAMISGDFDVSGIGTVTHVDGKRVYGWGHPFMQLGACDMPLMTGYVHHINSRVTSSFKIGSPLRTVGAINADVSTCISGWLERKPDLLPMTIHVRRGDDPKTKRFNLQVARHRGLTPSLVQMALVSSIDTEGDLPDEVTTEFKARIDIEGRPALVVQDTFSGQPFSGVKGPNAIFLPVGLLLNQLGSNAFTDIKVKSIEAQIQVIPERRTAEIVGVQLDAETYAPGDTVDADVLVRTFKGNRERIRLSVKLPEDLPEGSYSAMVGDDLHNLRQELRDKPYLNAPQSLDQLFEGLSLITAARRSTVVLRVGTTSTGVTSGPSTLDGLPASVVQILSNGRRSGIQQIFGSVQARAATPWMIQGADFVRFQVTKQRRPAVP